MVLQYVTAENTRIGQQVKFPGKNAWWNVFAIDKSNVVLKRAGQTTRVNKSYRLLQEMFENIKG